MIGAVSHAAAFAALVAGVVGHAPAQARPPQSRAPASSPGRYEGYSPILYDGYRRSSVFIPVRDGTRLAIDIFRPTLDGKVVETKLPVVWMHTPYNRRVYREPAIAPGVENLPSAEGYPGNALRLAKYGYVVATVDFRGMYGSFGTNKGYNHGEWDKAAWFDGYDVTEWLARQPWSTGRIGMWGCSATGGSTIQAAITRPPSLKAVFDMSSEFDAYRWVVPGGMAPATGPTFFPDSSRQWREGAIEGGFAGTIDGPDGPALLAQALASRQGTFGSPGNVPFRDSRSPAMAIDRFWDYRSPYTYLDRLKSSGIGIYAVANWNERIKIGPVLMHANLPGQTKLLFGPQAHCRWDLVREQQGFDIVTEQLRFFDYWLKGVRNGVMEEPRVTYYTYNAPAANAWRTSARWPLADEKRVRFYLGDGLLAADPPRAEGADTRTVDYDVASPDLGGPSNRVEKGIVYVTAPLAADMQMTGHATANIWLSSTAPDADLLATIEDVAPDGTATSYNMHGMLRASHRAFAKAPYANLGLPWHTGLRADARPLVPGTPVELQFDLLPISYVFPKGHRIRLVLTMADRNRTQRFSPAPAVTIHRSARHPSFVTLPLIFAKAG